MTGKLNVCCAAAARRTKTNSVKSGGVAVHLWETRTRRILQLYTACILCGRSVEGLMTVLA